MTRINHQALGDSPLSAWFTFGLLAFIGSFLLLPTSKMVNNVYYLLLALPALIALVATRGKNLVISRELILWGSLILWFVGIGAISGDAQFFRHLLYVTLFLVAAGQLADPRRLLQPNFMTGLFWVVAAYMGGSAVYYWLTGRYGFGERIIWLPSRMTGPIYSSIWISACFALALPSWLNEARWKTLVAALAVTLLIISFALQSRSGLVGLIVIFGLTVPYLLFRQRVATRYVLIGGVILLLAAILAYATIPQVAALVERGDSARFQLWGILINEWQTCGLLQGCGLAHKSQALLDGGGGILHPHSIYLSLALFGGLPALLIFLLLMALTLQKAWRTRNPWGLYLVAGLIGLAFDGSLLIGNPDELWLLVLLPAALIIHPKTQTYLLSGTACRS